MIDIDDIFTGIHELALHDMEPDRVVLGVDDGSTTPQDVLDVTTVETSPTPGDETTVLSYDVVTDTAVETGTVSVEAEARTATVSDGDAYVTEN
ncbi:hypothetical protein [Halosegnis longus]|uniref:hypothetical protein n=1 Tax=Halosegnis longus TaxID=2216012 RepID=UPI00129DBAEF|nr:hypothetical protein [Halosegnis longus]